jgi:predicted dienelactone hydrolase
VRLLAHVGNRWAGPALCACILAACATPPPPDSTLEIVARHAAQGYVDPSFREARPMKDQWQIAGQAVDVELTAPAAGGAYPLVIYLPGLGESADSGAIWRQTWTEAGYAVLSIQPVSLGTSVWSSEAALEGNFRDIAQRHFSKDSLAVRVSVAQGALSELARRRELRVSPLLEHVDATRVAIAGFDIGAQTALALAGERDDGIGSGPLAAAVKCVVLLSPYPGFPDGDPE